MLGTTPPLKLTADPRHFKRAFRKALEAGGPGVGARRKVESGDPLYDVVLAALTIDPRMRWVAKTIHGTDLAGLARMATDACRSFDSPTSKALELAENLNAEGVS